MFVVFRSECSAMVLLPLYHAHHFDSHTFCCLSDSKGKSLCLPRPKLFIYPSLYGLMNFNRLLLSGPMIKFNVALAAAAWSPELDSNHISCVRVRICIHASHDSCARLPLSLPFNHWHWVILSTHCLTIIESGGQPSDIQHKAMIEQIDCPSQDNQSSWWLPISLLQICVCPICHHHCELGLN